MQSGHIRALRWTPKHFHTTTALQHTNPSNTGTIGSFYQIAVQMLSQHDNMLIVIHSLSVWSSCAARNRWDVTCLRAAQYQVEATLASIWIQVLFSKLNILLCTQNTYAGYGYFFFFNFRYFYSYLTNVLMKHNFTLKSSSGLILCFIPCAFAHLCRCLLAKQHLPQ